MSESLGGPVSGTWHDAKIITDSVSEQGFRLTTFEIVAPRIILAEINTHKMLSKSNASSRAIPVKTMLQRARTQPYTPYHWGKNQKGMQALEELSVEEQECCIFEWEAARMDALRHTGNLLQIGVHKQITNRLLEPFLYQTSLITGTEWDNFFHLRNHADAHPDFLRVARMMQEAYNTSSPKIVHDGEWHTPYVAADEGIPLTERPQIAAGRCARLSYLTQDGRRDLSEDVGLYKRLLESGHMSPLEHPARPMTDEELELFAQPKVRWGVGADGRTYWQIEHDQNGEVLYTHFLGNFQGWVQLRKLIPGEEDILGYRARGL